MQCSPLPFSRRHLDQWLESAVGIAVDVLRLGFLDKPHAWVSPKTATRLTDKENGKKEPTIQLIGFEYISQSLLMDDTDQLSP